MRVRPGPGLGASTRRTGHWRCRPGQPSVHPPARPFAGSGHEEQRTEGNARPVEGGSHRTAALSPALRGAELLYPISGVACEWDTPAYGADHGTCARCSGNGSGWLPDHDGGRRPPAWARDLLLEGEDHPQYRPGLPFRGVGIRPPAGATKSRSCETDCMPGGMPGSSTDAAPAGPLNNNGCSGFR